MIIQKSRSSTLKIEPVITIKDVIWHGRSPDEYIDNIFVAAYFRLDDMLSRHSKVFVVRFDITFPATFIAEPNNKKISALTKKLSQYLNSKKIDFHYLWSREQKTSKNQHYHIILFLNGSKIQNEWGLRNKTEKIWADVLGDQKILEEKGGLVHLVDNRRKNGVPLMIQRPSLFSTEDKKMTFKKDRHSVLREAAYLSKKITKEINPKGFRQFGASQIRKEKPVKGKIVHTGVHGKKFPTPPRSPKSPKSSQSPMYPTLFQS